METVSGAILLIVNFMLYSFWFALLVFAVFILYMTFITIKVKENKQTEEIKRKEYKKYYRSLLYSVPVIGILLLSMLHTIS